MNDSDATAVEQENEAEATPLNVTVDVSSPSACQRHVTVAISREDIDRYFSDAVSEMMGDANVPGFRQGRAPRKLIESQFRKELNEKIKGTLLMDSMTQVTEDQDFSAISEPDFDFEAVEIPSEGPLKFEFDIEVRPEFDMPKWKGLKLERATKEFKKKEIDDQIARLLEKHAVLEPTSDPAESEDVLVLDIDFKHDGKSIATLSEREARLRSELSFEDGILKDFEKTFAGSKAGDKKTCEIEISGQAHNESLRGEKITAEIEVLDVKRLVPPEITDALLSKIGNFETEGDLRDAIKDELERQLSYHQNQEIRQQITGLLVESADWELPPELLKRQAGRELSRAVMELRSAGFSDDQIRAHVNTLRQNSEDTTSRALKEHFILERIAEDEDIEAADEDYQQEVALMAMQSGDSPRSVMARIEKQGLMDALRNQIVERKAIDCIKEAATFKDVAYNPQKAATYAIDFAIGGRDSELPEAKHGGDQTDLRQPVDRT